MQDNGNGAAYRQSELPVSRRVADLLDRMTVAEKAGQAVGLWAGHMGEHVPVDELKDAVSEHGLGVVAPFGWGGAAATELDDVLSVAEELQRVATEETRLGIPLMFNVDAVHGNAYVAGATVFPNGLGAAATWDVDRVERAAEITATEVAAVGAHQNYSPTCDVGREPRWGRVFETFGESPTLCSAMTAAKVRGYQGEGIEGEGNVVATAKHFPAYSEPERGEDAAPVDVSEYKLRNTLTPPVEAAIDAGVESVMPSYASIDGEAAHGSARYLTDVLRGELGFDGHVVSDWGGIRHLHENHGVTADWRESVYRTREAGLDVASVGTVGHVEHLIDLVESGDLDESVLDESAARVLATKFRLGLFEDASVDGARARELLGADDHQAVAKDAARTSMTLLKNDGLLPLDGDEDVLLAGPNADDLVHQVGGWSIEYEEGIDGTTIREALADRIDGDLTYEQGTTLNGELDVDAAAEKAAEADVAVVAVGEGWYLHEFGAGDDTTETGEWPTRSNVRLSDAQRSLVRAIHATGTPVVGVLVTGRPLIVDWMAEHVPAILMAYYPGTQGGPAVADTLLGETDPGGRLPISIPRSHGHLSTHHDFRRHPTPIGEDEHPPSYDPLYAFGHGLSYTDFEYRDLALGAEEVAPGDDVEISVTVENVGDRDGSTVVQAYAGQATPRRVRPDRELVGFERVALDAGEERTVALSVPVRDFGYYRPGDGHVVEADTYTVAVEDMEAAFAVDGSYR